MRDFLRSWAAQLRTERGSDTIVTRELLPARRAAESTKPKKTPTEFQIFAYGPNRGTHIGEAPSDVWLDEAHADKIIAEWKRRGNRLIIDYEHASIKGAPEGAPKSGEFALEKRADGLWAVNVTWTKKATAFLLADEYIYFSPGFTTEKDASGKEWVNTIFHLALVNVPATDNMQPLMRSATGPHMDLYEQIVNALGITLDETQAAALKEVCAQYAEMMSAATTTATATPETAAATPPADEMKIASAARKITGKTDPDEVEGILLAFQDGYQKARTIVSTRGATNTKELDDVLSKANAEGKLEPGQQATLRAGCLNPDKSVNQSALKVLKIRLSAAIPTGVGASVAAGSQAEAPANSEQPIPADPRNVTVRLSSADKEMGKMFGANESETSKARASEIVANGFRRTLGQ